MKKIKTTGILNEKHVQLECLYYTEKKHAIDICPHNALSPTNKFHEKSPKVNHN